MTTEQENTAEVELAMPTPDRAASFMRELTWGERLDGHIDAGMAGAPMVTLYRLEHVYNMLDADKHFYVDFGRLQHWVSDAVGDSELADKIRSAREMPVGVEEDEQAVVRERVTNLLGLRVEQCNEVLGAPEEGDAD